MLEPVLEILLEIAGNVLVELLFNGLLSRDMFTWRTLRWLVILVTAGGMGWASTAVLPKPIIPWAVARLAYVAVVPLLVAAFIDGWNRRRALAGRRAGLLATFGDAWLFAFAFSLVRFLATM